MPRYTLDVGKSTDEILKTLAESKHLLKGEILRRALATYLYLVENTGDGRKVSITDQDDRVLEHVRLP